MTDTIIIIGAGIIGLSTAYEYLRRVPGADVTLLEAGELAGRGASWANGSMIHPSQAWPWPETVSEAISDAKSARDIAIDSYRLAARSSQRLSENFDAFAIDPRHRKSGSLKLYSTRADLDQVLDGYALLARQGLRITLKWPDEIKSVLGFAMPKQDIFAALHFPDDHTGPARIYCQHLIKRINAMGGKIRLKAPVTALSALKADSIIVCAGSGSAKLLGRQDLFSARGYSRTYHMPGRGQALPQLPIMDDKAHMAVMAIGDHLRVTGGADMGGISSADIYQAMEAHSLRLLPHLALDIRAAKYEDWSADRPMSRTGPMIGQVKKGLWVNTGHGHMGWTLCAGAAQSLVDKMLA